MNPDSEKTDFSMFFEEYIDDLREGVQKVNSALLALEQDRSLAEPLNEVFRVVHTLKSSSTMIEFSDIAELAHLSEDLLDRLRGHEIPVNEEVVDVLFEVNDTLEKMAVHHVESKGEFDFKAVAEKVRKLASQEAVAVERGERKPAAIPSIEKIKTVKVHVDLLDSLFNLAGELIIIKNRVDTIASGWDDKELKAALTAMGRMISDLQENVSVARLVLADEVFRRFPRMVHDLAREHQKEVDLVMEGREIEMDKAALDEIGEPLIHLLRNAIDHGIETPEERVKQEKDRQGTIRLSAKRTESHLLILVEDDGRGIDFERIREAALLKGFVGPEEVGSLREKGVLDLLFIPGVTGSEKVTELSGRGVGLDVVRTSARKFGGTVEVETRKGEGTRFTLKLPLATAIIQTLIVGVGKHRFAIPSDIVTETVRLMPGDVRAVKDKEVLVLREDVVPFVRLGDVLGTTGNGHEGEPVAVIVSGRGSPVALGVDTVVDQVENIIKPFDPIARKFKGFSGGTIMGDGRVVLLLDVPGLLGPETL